MKSMILTFPLLLTMLFNSCDQGVESIPTCSAAILDTTSHVFAWTITELGDGGGSILRDVAIINDTLVYAVGEIYLRDSTGQIDPLPYNAAVWNGCNWTPKRISVTFQGYMITPPLEAVFAFSPTNIWLSAGVPIHGDGQTWTQYHLFNMGVLNQSDGSVNKIWASSPSNVIFAGNKGTIVRYNNGTWQKLSSGTTLPIRDIWGATDPGTGRQTVLAVASGSFPEEGKKLVSFDGTTVSSLADEGLSWNLSGIWFVPNCRYYIVGAGKV